MKTLILIALALASLAGCAAGQDRVETARDICHAEYGDDRGAFAQCVRLALRRDESDQADRQYASGVAMQQIGRSMSDYGAYLSRPSVTCTTLGFGSFAQTTCR